VSQENVAGVAALVEAINRRNFDDISELLHPDFVFDAAIGAVEQRPYAGGRGLRAFVADMDAIWEGYRIDLKDVAEAGEQAVALMHISGTARSSGVPLDQKVAQVITWRDDRICHVVAYTVPAEALKAVGLSE
jgi:ketosteroid isomerase-like protein